MRHKQATGTVYLKDMDRIATWASCPDNLEHETRDSCWNCAPYWIHFPTCPDCGAKLGFNNPAKEYRYDKNGERVKLPNSRRKCPDCGKFATIRFADCPKR